MLTFPLYIIFFVNIEILLQFLFFSSEPPSLVHIDEAYVTIDWALRPDSQLCTVEGYITKRLLGRQRSSSCLHLNISLDATGDLCSITDTIDPQ